MKKHLFEKIIFVYNLFLLIALLIYLLSGIIFDDSFKVLDILFRIFVSLMPFSWMILLYVRRRRKKRGYKDYLNINSMRNAKKEIPHFIYKYVSLNKKSAKCKLDYQKLNTLENNQLWMSTAAFLNDIFEGQFWHLTQQFIKENSKEDIEKIENILIHSNDLYVQTSFSYEKDNILLWSHYANAFYGYCIEYEVSKKDFLFPVLYTKNRIVNTGDKNNKKVNKNLKKISLQKYKCSSDEYEQYLFYIRTFKSKIWEYEKEVRLIDKSVIGSRKVHIEKYGLKVSKIIIGYKCEFKSELVEIAENLNVPVTYMNPDFGNEKYSIKEVN